jgi:hypothetical protein
VSDLAVGFDGFDIANESIRHPSVMLGHGVLFGFE